MQGKRPTRETVERAFWLWISGYTYREIAVEVGVSKEHTIMGWKNRYAWEERGAEVRQSLNTRNNQRLADQILADEADDLKTIINLREHAKANIGKQVNGKTEMLTPKNIQTLASALDTMSRRKRIIRQGHDTIDRAIIKKEAEITINFGELSREQIKRIADGEDPRVVMGLVGAGESGSD